MSNLINPNSSRYSHKLSLFLAPQTKPKIFLHSPFITPHAVSASLPQTTAHSRPKHLPDSPIPEFAKEFIRNSCNSRSVLNKSTKSISFQREDTPKTRATSKKMLSRPNSSKRSEITRSLETKEPALHQILRLHRPQILHFYDKSRIKVFTTVSLAVRKSKARLLKNAEMIKKRAEKEKKLAEEEKPGEETNEDIIIYDKPAVTYGEKLWRLKELSIF